MEWKCGRRETCRRAQKINGAGWGGGEQRLCNAPPEAEPPSTGAAGGQPATSREGAELLDPDSCPGMGSEFQLKPRIPAPLPVRPPQAEALPHPSAVLLEIPQKRPSVGQDPEPLTLGVPGASPRGLQGREKSRMEKLKMRANWRGEELDKWRETRGQTERHLRWADPPLRGAPGGYRMWRARSPGAAETHFPVWQVEMEARKVRSGPEERSAWKSCSQNGTRDPSPTPPLPPALWQVSPPPPLHPPTHDQGHGGGDRPTSQQ